MVDNPYARFVAITPSDSTNIQASNDFLTDAIYVGGAGVVVVVGQDDVAVSFTCVAGQVLKVRAKRVNSTSTTATLLVALYY